MSWFSGFEMPDGPERGESIETPEASVPIESLVPELSALEISYVTRIEGLNPSDWQELAPAERLAALNELESRLAEIEGRPAIELRGQSLGPGSYGYFDPLENIMVVSEDLLRSPSPQEAIDTVAHEGRHAYQHYAIDHPGFHPDAHEVAAWRDNFDNYLTASLYGYEAYRNQPVERDAWAFGEMVRTLFGEKH